MEIKEEDIKDFVNKKVRIVTSKNYTYVGEIISIGTDYIKILDKYNQRHLLPFSNLIHIEEIQ